MSILFVEGAPGKNLCFQRVDIHGSPSEVPVPSVSLFESLFPDSKLLISPAPPSSSSAFAESNEEDDGEKANRGDLRQYAPEARC
jgi:hypothetical protein